MNEDVRLSRGVLSPSFFSQFPYDTKDVAAIMAADCPRYSICTLVTKPAEYEKMVQNFRAGGLVETAGCEFLYLDNSTNNNYEAFSGYNMFLQAARGQYLILCHQDVLLLQDQRNRLDEIVEELDAIDPSWALFGNAGGVWPNQLAIRISDKFGANQSRGGPFPVASLSLDENFIVVRANANLALSADLSGFHFYGTELCLVASQLGYRAYVVDFHLYHAGEAKVDKAFWDIQDKIIRKYSHSSGFRMIRSTCAEFVITPWAPLSKLLSDPYLRYISRFFNRFFRPSTLPHPTNKSTII